MGRESMNMKRINLYITENQEKVLKELSKEKGITFSEYLRRIVDNHIEKGK